MNKKNQKIVFILIAALLVAVIGSFSLYKFLTPKKTTIYTFKYNVTAGTVVTGDMLVAVQADSSIYVAGKKSDISSQYVTGDTLDSVLKSGDTLRMDVTAGMPLTVSMLTTRGGSSVEIAMTPNKIAISIPITNITGVTNDLKPGSRVNIYAIGNINNKNYSSMLLFENMRILAVTKNNGNLTGVTVETDVDESLELVYYSSCCNLYLGLIDSSGYEYSNVNHPTYSNEQQNFNQTIDNTLDHTTEETTENITEETTESTIENTTSVENMPEDFPAEYE